MYSQVDQHRLYLVPLGKHIKRCNKWHNDTTNYFTKIRQRIFKDKQLLREFALYYRRAYERSSQFEKKYDILSDFNCIILSNYKTEKCSQFCSDNDSENGMSLEELKYLFINFLDDGTMNKFISSYALQNPNYYLAMMSPFLDRLQ